MRIYEHGSDWWYDFSYKGVRERATTGVAINGQASKAAAIKVGKQKQLDAQMRWQQTGGKAPSEVPTIAEAVVRYHKAKGSKIGNAKNAKDNLKYLMWCRDEIGPDTPITDITDEVIQNLVNKRAQDTVHGKPISAATVNRSVVVPLRQLMNWMGLKAKIQGLHMIDWADLELVEAGPRERVLTYDELDSIRAAVVAENDGHLDAFEFALLCGFRLGNFTQLRWDEVFFEPAQGYPNGRIAVIQKGGKTHTIPMTIGIRELL
jgi:integrase